MPQPELIAELKAVGMNDKQAALYLSALRLGTVPASRIASGAEVNRATAYHLLEEMVQQRFLAASDRFGVRHYTALPPRELIALLEERRVELARLQERLTGTIGQLEELRNTSTVEPVVRVFQGRVGMKDIFRRVLRATGKIQMWDLTRVDVKDEEMGRYLREEFVPERVRRGIASEIIADEAPAASSDPALLKEIRPMQKAAIDAGVDVRIYDDTVAICSYAPEDQFGVEIESPYVAKAMKEIFNSVWTMLPAPEKPAASAPSPKQARRARAPRVTTQVEPLAPQQQQQQQQTVRVEAQR